MLEIFFSFFLWAIASDVPSLENSFKNKAHTDYVQFCFGVITEDDTDIDVNLVSIVALLS